MQPPLYGILPAVVTPFDDAGHFAYRPFENLLLSIYEAGAHGVYVCGQTGEGMQQPVEQRKRIAEAALRNSPAASQVIVHVGANSVDDALVLARHASSIGVTAVSSLPPYGSYSFADVKRYYEALAAASDVPLLVYYFPSIYRSIQTLSQILELCSIPGVVGLKFTDFDLYRLNRLKQCGAVVYSGRDEVLTAGLLMGADGGIGTFYNVIPEAFVACFEHSRQGRWCEAREIQGQINDLIEIVLEFPFFAAVRRMLAWSGIDCGSCLAPRASLSPEEEIRLKSRLRSSPVGRLLAPRMKLSELA